MDTDTIAAIATSSGKGGIGIVRVSGDKAITIAKKISRKNLAPRYATYTAFYDHDANKLDEGIALFFPAPNSFTGEDVVELQGHGGPVVMDLLLQATLKHGARLARPGEFSERAFLNDKIDLVQAEAIADIIESKTETAAKSAMRSLSGEFSTKVNHLVEKIISLRTYVEAAIDFPDEEVDLLSDRHVLDTLDNITAAIEAIWLQTRRGSLLRDGLTIVIIGKPNAGKSSLLNLLAGENLAIVNQQAGTTRDILREDIQLDGLPLRVIDTAGLRHSTDEVEQEGIRRAKNEVTKSDMVLLLRDISENKQANDSPVEYIFEELTQNDIQIPDSTSIVVVNNKIDLVDINPSIRQQQAFTEVALSAKTQQGLDLLIQYLKSYCGINDNAENNFVARRRHIDAISKAKNMILVGKEQLLTQGAGELLAEDLKQAQHHLSQVTGKFSSDDLLGEIFSSFCIGK